MSKKNYRSDFLFPRTSFFIGAGSIFNLAGNYFEINYSSSDTAADCRALANDWGVIGNDLRKVMSDHPIDSLSLETIK